MKGFQLVAQSSFLCQTGKRHFLGQSEKNGWLSVTLSECVPPQEMYLSVFLREIGKNTFSRNFSSKVENDYVEDNKNPASYLCRKQGFSDSLIIVMGNATIGHSQFLWFRVELKFSASRIVARWITVHPVMFQKQRGVHSDLVKRHCLKNSRLLD